MEFKRDNRPPSVFRLSFTFDQCVCEAETEQGLESVSKPAGNLSSLFLLIGKLLSDLDLVSVGKAESPFLGPASQNPLVALKEEKTEGRKKEKVFLILLLKSSSFLSRLVCLSGTGSSGRALSRVIFPFSETETELSPLPFPSWTVC